MIHTFLTYAIRPAGLLLVVVFASSLLWCGDAACWAGSSDDQCASLICSLLPSHATPHENHNDNCSTECMCVCHMPTIPAKASDTEHLLTGQTTSFEFAAFTPPYPTHPIYHPPKS